MAPQLEATDFGGRQVGLFFRAQLDESCPDVTAADVDRKDAVVPREDPGGHELHASYESRVIRWMADRP